MRLGAIAVIVFVSATWAYMVFVKLQQSSLFFLTSKTCPEYIKMLNRIRDEWEKLQGWLSCRHWFKERYLQVAFIMTMSKLDIQVQSSVIFATNKSSISLKGLFT